MRSDLAMDFMTSYKQLEKLCGEIFNDNRKVSAYIDEMVNTPRGSFYVNGWNNDLQQLKYYRWVRNQIVHEPQCSEENMCDPQDALWLDNFYLRIMKQTDPLTLYAKATKPKPTINNSSKQNAMEYHEQFVYDENFPNKNTSAKHKISPILLTCSIILAAVIFLYLKKFL